MAYAELSVDDGRVVEDEGLGRPGRTALVDEDELLLDEVLRMLLGIGHGRGAADEDGVLSVEAADPFQAPEHVGHVAAEDPPVDVKLVHYHVLQIGEELLPLGVVGQDAGVEHVRVGDHHVALLADRLPGVVRRVTVVGEGLDVRLQLADEAMHLRHLVVGEGLRGKEVDGPRLGLLDDLLEHGDVVAEGLAACRGRDEDHVPALVHELDGAGLMAVELRDAPSDEDLLYARIYPRGIWSKTTLRCGYVGDGCRVLPEAPVVLGAGKPF